MKSIELKRTIPLIAISPFLLALTACGGGDGGGDKGGVANTAPTVEAGAAQSVLARKDVTLDATAADSDGSIASFAWEQESGTAVTLAATDDSFLEFTTPDVSEQETLTFRVTVTDDEGATATDTVDVAVTPSITLSAKAYDGPLAGATVTVKVGDQTYTTTADANGVFTLDIGSPDPGAMITIVATGAAGQQNAELVSIAGTFGALVAAAGEDGTLESTESGAVDVTNISTAKAVLMIDANGGEPPVDDGELAELEKSVDTDAMLELATVIKLVIDADVPLPEGVESTFDMASDSSTVEAVIKTAETTDPGSFEETFNAIISDPNLMPSFTAGNLPNLYFINRPGNYMYADRGFFLELKEDKTGFLYGNGSANSSPLTWSLSESGRLVMEFGEPLTQTLGCTVESARVTCVQSITQMEIGLINDGAQTDAVTVYQLGEVTYPNNPELTPKPVEESFNRLGMAPGGLVPFVAEDVVGTWSVPLALPYTGINGAEYETGLLTFAADGTGIRQGDGATFEWAIDSKTGALSIAFANGDQLDAYWLREEGDMAIDAMFVMNTAGGDVYAVPYFAVEVDTAILDGMVQADADGEWAYTDIVGLTYVLDSVSNTATATYHDEEGAVTYEYPEEFLFDGTKFDVLSWYDIENDVDVVNCAGVTTCQNYYSSQWYPLSMDSSGRILMLEIDNSWGYDPAASGNHFRGDLRYHHAMNRWLAPVVEPAAGMQKMSADENLEPGDRVRALMDETLVGGRVH